jgi:hypothetical protein
VSAAKTKVDELPPDVPKEVPEEVIAEDVPEEPVVVEEVVPGVPAKRAIGPKEAPPFKWKLIGHANSMALTLFKAAERDDVEAQFERIRKEGYYTNLQILDVNTKVEQPPQPKSAKKAARAGGGGRARSAKASKISAGGRGGATAVVEAPMKSGKKGASGAPRSKAMAPKSGEKSIAAGKKVLAKKSAGRKAIKKKK